ncbi:hypothetical protein BDR06DRAFT_963363 [Suillus hirtellus]|nr:hypothetical protein BDR06DRAFT_963363 [Suillus hirtellus]
MPRRDRNLLSLCFLQVVSIASLSLIEFHQNSHFAVRRHACYYVAHLAALPPKYPSLYKRNASPLN